MRIAIVTETFPPEVNGVAMTLGRIVEGLLQRGHAVQVVRPRQTETTALGAAYLAGLATGFWTSAHQISSQWAQDRRFEPSISQAQRMTGLVRWRQAVARSRSWAQD